MSKTVLVGVTGCIAAYKSCEIVRGLQKAGVRAKVVMTPHATQFVGPTTFRALTHEPVAVDLFDGAGDPIHHVSLAQECDLFLIAPCTANVTAKIAHGIADDLLTTTALATKAPIYIAPAMNVNMYENPITQANIETLVARGVGVVDPSSGYLACGDVGAGRLADVEVIVKTVLDALGVTSDLQGKSVLITAGPTREAIDAVRYISNASSGKTGYLLAQAALDRGASVTLVSGPCSLTPPQGCTFVPVTSAREMLAACKGVFTECDIAIFSAAVADMRPVKATDRKLKKSKDGEALSKIELMENPDILATLAATKSDRQVVVGFAAETDDVLSNAQSKLKSKHADMIVANDVRGGAVFGADENQVSFVSSNGVLQLPRASKCDIANKILDWCCEFSA